MLIKLELKDKVIPFKPFTSVWYIGLSKLRFRKRNEIELFL